MGRRRAARNQRIVRDLPPPPGAPLPATSKRITIRALPEPPDGPHGFVLPIGFAGPGVVVSMLSTRTKLFGMPKLLDAPAGAFVREGRAPNIFIIEFQDELEADIEISVDFRGEPPTPGEVTIAATEDDLDSGGTTIEEMVQKRTEVVEEDGSPAQDFFWEYDLATNLAVGAPQAQFEQPIDELQSALCQRVILKARRYGTELPYPKNNASEEVIGHVKKLSKLQLELYRKHFGGATVPSDLVGLRDAFLEFASGKLRLDDEKVFSNAEPDSGWYFFFAEFALLAAHHVEDQDEKDFWLAICRTFAWTQEVYVHCYAAAEAAARFADYDPSNYTGADVPQDIVDAWAATYDPATHDDLHKLTAKNASAAFPGEKGQTDFPL